jgi:Tol biopolymer transport system component
MFIAMEYIEGQTLKEKIKEGPLQLREAVRIAEQIARGLAAAHEKGIVHRDIKSANVMLTGKDQVKIMDFGLAKVAAGSLVTKAGTTLGTISYMSPEQARGETVDCRTDVFSLGVILYEMITGQLPFKGEYESAIIYAILNTDPEPLTAVRTGVPIALEQIISKLLAKDRENRYQHIDELPVDLKNIDLTSSGPSHVPMDAAASMQKQIPGGMGKSSLWKVVAPLLFFTGLAAGTMIWRIMIPGTHEQKLIRKVSIIPSHRHDFDTLDDVIISDDGTRIVYTATDSSGRHLYWRKTDQLESNVIPGTKGAHDPFFSLDGKWVGFASGGTLLKALLGGGSPIPICEVGSNFAGGCWESDETIIWGSLGGGMMRVAIPGGRPEPITIPDENNSHRWPEMLPDGKTILFTIWPSKHNEMILYNTARIAILSLKSGDWKSLIEGGSCAHFAASPGAGKGHIVYARIGGLLAAPFDSDKLEIKGAPIPVLNNILIYNTGSAPYGISREGTLLYLPWYQSDPTVSYNSTLVWVDRNGNSDPVSEKRNRYFTPRISPDGRRVALIINDIIARSHIWIYSIENNRFNQLTFTGSEYAPIWDAMGEWVTFGTNREGTSGMKQIVRKLCDGSGEAEPVLDKEASLLPGSWSHDGKLLAFYEVNPVTQRDIWILNTQDGSTSPFLNADANEASPVFSPVGRWLAYTSNQSGQFEIYIQPYPATGAKYLVSVGGGMEPVWAPDGSELYYRNGDMMMAVQITMESQFRYSAPKELFKGQFRTGSFYRPAYDIHPDGDRFLMIKDEEEAYETRKINVIINWFEELREKSDTK